MKPKEIDYLDHLAEEAMKILLHDEVRNNNRHLKDDDFPLLAEQSYNVALAMLRVRRDLIDKIS